MCFYEQTVWACGFWKWGPFRSQCTKEYRTGETCGLKLVWSTDIEEAECFICNNVSKKKHRITKMTRDIERWTAEGNRSATIEKTEQELRATRRALTQLYHDHSRIPAASRKLRLAKQRINKRTG
ncbi:hypothetical protein BKA67DRAFT_519631 [Truncatella angustata]|uniref:Uncharacterized protein n=1 Tax=Truncatella angustata TaxID=152316 RepID=A0A9P8ZX64_9PEZI|nr:uncharacterized protein BKA67DRAFT_519631 [Truncatella angustata]KAH6653657.1 hypothetical protein BKA67DRAFT_519631 [Truncatella angustata]